MSRSAALAALIALGPLAACTSTPGAADAADVPATLQDATDAMAAGDATVTPGVHVPTAAGFPTLADYGFFEGSGASQRPVDGVIPYEVNAALYADFAAKHRFLYVPPGQHIGFVGADRWDLPVGAVLIKTFAYPVDERDASRGERLVETRLLIRQATGFRAETYQWNDAQTAATRMVAGASVPVSWTDATGAARTATFQIPNLVECGRCHGRMDPTDANPMNVLGIRTGQMNRSHVYANGAAENQIDHLAALGLFATAPAPAATLERFAEPFGTGTLEARARSYLHANCAHCHNPTSPSGFSGLTLNIENNDLLHLGICKIPSSAENTGGRSFDIVPGMPDQSVLPYRMALMASTAMMPPLGRSLADAEGIALINQWIASLTGRTLSLTD